MKYENVLPSSPQYAMKNLRCRLDFYRVLEALDIVDDGFTLRAFFKASESYTVEI